MSDTSAAPEQQASAGTQVRKTVLLQEKHRLALSLAEKDKEIDALRKQLEKQDRVVQNLQRELASGSTDMADYEAELNEYRRSLETDRQKLNRDLQELCDRNEELIEALREAELEMSRERATLARERNQINRMRDELRFELERVQKAAEAKERMASYDMQKTHVRSAGDETPISQRLAQMRQRLGFRDSKS